MLVVNKADREGADRAVRDLISMLELRGHDSTPVEIVRTVATSGKGIDELALAIERYRDRGRPAPAPPGGGRPRRGPGGAGGPPSGGGRAGGGPPPPPPPPGRRAPGAARRGGAAPSRSPPGRRPPLWA